MANPYVLYGQHAVLAALKNPERVNNGLLITDEVASRHGSLLSQAEIVPRQTLNKLCPPGAVHQGMVLKTKPLVQPAPQEWLFALPRDVPLRVLVLDQVTDPHNIGAMLRSAAAFGASAVVVQAKHSPPETALMAKVASGGLERVDYIHATNISKFLQEIQQLDFHCLGMDSSPDGGELTPDIAHKRTALVLGAEGKGLRRLVREHCDELVRLPTLPEFPSLNVSNAAALGLYVLRV